VRRTDGGVELVRRRMQMLVGGLLWISGNVLRWCWQMMMECCMVTTTVPLLVFL
jgi:hypothetical protein